MLNNVSPGFLPNGALAGAGTVPPSPVRTIGDALNDKNISWAYYGGAYNAAVRLSNIAVQLNPTAPNLSAAAAQDPADAIGVAYCQICNPFQYASSIMADPAVRTAHMKDVSDLDTAIADSTLPAVSYVKPDGLLDGHPASSKVSLFEGFVRDILDRLDANPKLKAETAVIITFDEAGGYFDSGYVQPIDYFGDSNRIPLIIVSPYSTGGTVTHTYYDHVSIVKFIERNWKLQPLTGRSRDNLPNPVQKADSPYVPKNSPALGDLFDAFDFDKRITNLVNFNPTRTASPGRI
jgi:phospholipase C